MLGKKKKADSKIAIKPKENISEEENVITPEEFEKLEKEEGKNLPKLETKNKGRKDSGDISLDNLMFKIEKAEGRMEALDSQRAATDERISRLSEEIGELRSSLLEKERAFNTIESGFSKIKDATEEIQPQKIAKEMQKSSEQVLQFEAKIESLQLKLDELTRSNQKIRDILDKIKSFENIVAVLEEFQDKLNAIDENKKYISRQAGKVESIFSEINKKVKEFRQYQERIDLNKDMLNEVMKTTDMIEMKLEKLASKDDLTEFDGKLNKINLNYDDRVQDMKELMKKMLLTLKERGLDKIMKDGPKVKQLDFASKSDLSNLEKQLNDMKNNLAKAPKGGKLAPEYEEVLQQELKRMEATRESLKDKMEDIENKYFDMVSNQRAEGAKSDNKAAQSQITVLSDRLRRLESTLQKMGDQKPVVAPGTTSNKVFQAQIGMLTDKLKTFETMIQDLGTKSPGSNSLLKSQVQALVERIDRLESKPKGAPVVSQKMHHLESEIQRLNQERAKTSRMDSEKIKQLESQLDEMNKQRTQITKTRGARMQKLEAKVDTIAKGIDPQTQEKIKRLEDEIRKWSGKADDTAKEKISFLEGEIERLKNRKPTVIHTTKTEIRKVPVKELPKSLDDQFKFLLSEAYSSIEDDKLEAAADMYEKANLVYSQLKVSKPYEESYLLYSQLNELFNSINRKMPSNQ